MAGRLAGRTLLTCLLVSFVVCTSWHTASAGDGKVKSKEVDFAPEADLINGNDDIDPNGHCAEEIKNYCSSVTAGLGALAKCISENIDQMDMPEANDGTESVVVSDYCREEVYGFYIERNTNINKNVPLAKACKIDANKFCNVTWFFGYKAGQVIACLRDVKDKLTPTCQKQVQEVQQEGGRDWRADPQLHEACEVDATSLCKDVRNGAGRVQACLRDKRMQLSWACEEQLFRQEMENADDIRLSMRLYAKCLPDKRRFCAEVAPGSARVKDCLEEHRNEKEFSAECKEEVDTMIERRVRDFRLDSRLRTVCETDIYSMCAFFGDLDTIDNDDASVIRCLQDYVGEIQSDKCKAQVKKYQQLAAEDIRFDVPLADACYEDRQKLCANVPPGSARVIRCLTNQRSKLSSNCRAVMFDEEVRFSENIDFQFPMKSACKDELELYCKDVPHGQARAIRCLQDNKFKKDFGKECREAVRSYENESASDYRLNFRLSTSCRNDIQELCKDVCKAEDGQICSGRVLRCLTEHIDEVKSDACQKEVFYFEKMEVTDFRNDVILAAACRADVESYCDKIEPGEGRVHECLRKFRSRISEQCRKEELLLEEQEAENVELRPSLLKSCRDERQMFCKDVAPGQARVFRCLAEKMSDLDFGDTCRGEIINKLQRRQANWKLDPPLRKACRRAVQEHCAAEDRTNGEEGVVYKCLIRQFDDVDAGCQKELGRAVHMAFYVWQPGAILTSDCDEDIQKLCLATRPNMAKTPGAVGTCLAGLLEQMGSSSARRMLPDTTGKDSTPPPATLSEKCRAISDVAEPPNMKHAFEASLSVALLQSQLTVVESATGWQTMKRDRNGVAQSVTLTGWTALAGIAALIVCIMWAGSYAYKRYRGINEGPGYTVVLKGKH